MVEQCQGIFKWEFWYQNSSLGQLENLLRHPREVNNPKQMALNKPILSTMVMVEPKTKKEKEKNVDVECRNPTLG